MEHQTGLDNYLKMLSLHRIREIYLKEAENAANTKLSYQEYLHRLIEQQVLSKMHDVNQKEIQMGQMAMQRGHSRQVRDFGRRLQRDHQANDRLVRTIARREGVDLANYTPNTPEEQREADRDNRMHQDLESASGRDFDRAFMRAMAEGHADVARDLSRAQHTLRNGRVRALVTSTILTVRRHQRMARTLESRV